MYNYSGEFLFYMSICVYYDKFGDYFVFYSNVFIELEKCILVDFFYGIEKLKNFILLRFEVIRDIELFEVEYVLGYGKEIMLIFLVNIERLKRYIQVVFDLYEFKFGKLFLLVEIIGDNFDWIKRLFLMIKIR